MATANRPRNKMNGSGKGKGQPGGMRRNKNPNPGTLGRKGVGKGTKR